MDEEAFAWNVDKNRVIVTFVKSFPVTYCTISVVQADGLIKHYHDGVVYNLEDVYNEHTGRFLAFKKALRLRFDVRFKEFLFIVGRRSQNVGIDFSHDYIELRWKDYHKYWSHFLSALMDGKVVEYDEFVNPNTI